VESKAAARNPVRRYESQESRRDASATWDGAVTSCAGVDSATLTTALSC
jgi:hypothetical protein